jgi:hypothetical protein
MKKKILLLSFALVLNANLRAQVTIGGPTTPKAGALLDLNSTTQGGLVLSNVDLTDLSVIPANTFVNISTQQDTNQELAGMIVYNTDAATGVGVYVWDGDDWIKPCAPPAPGPITFSTASFLAGVKYAAIVAPVAGATSYVWTLPPEFTVFGASDGATITFSAPVGTYSIVVRAKNACGESSRYVGTQQIAVTAITNCDAQPSYGGSVITSANVEFVNNNASTYTRNGITLSTPVRIVGRSARSTLASTSNSLVDYRDHSTDSDYGSWFTGCMVALYADILCPGEWRVPSAEDFCKYANDDRTNTNSNYAITGQPIGGTGGVDGWLLGGIASGSSVLNVGVTACYWSSTPVGSSNGDYAYVNSSSFDPSSNSGRYYGLSLRCVK